jgi:hypothetical protein
VSPICCTSGAGVPTRGTSYWGHPPRVAERKMTCSQSGCKVQNTLFSAARTGNSRCLVLWSKDAMRVSFCFERSCPEQRPRAALKPQEPHSSGRPGGGLTLCMAKRPQGWVKCEGRLRYYKDSSCSLPLAATPRSTATTPRTRRSESENAQRHGCNTESESERRSRRMADINNGQNKAQRGEHTRHEGEHTGTRGAPATHW